MSPSDKGYGDLRDRCIRLWGFHRDASGSVADLWGALSKEPCFRTVGETSAPMLVAEMAALIDIQRHELASLQRLERRIKAAVDELAGDERGS